MRFFRFSPKHVLLSTCLLLVLVAGVTAQIAAQSTISLDLTVIILPSPESVLAFDASVNGVEYCILTPLSTGSSLPSASQLKGAITADEITLNGEVIEGPCPLTLGAGGGGFGVSDYRSTNGGSVGPFTATITFDGSLPGDFTIVIVFTVGDGGLHSESKITGTLLLLSETDCMFENLASQYAFVTGAGFTLNLQLLTHNGACSILSNEGFVFQLPTLTFGNVAPVGGLVMPANTFALVAPWLAVIGLVGCIGTIVVVVKPWKKPEN
jgi:hypothetical protein